MDKITRYLFIAIVLISFVIMSSGLSIAAEKKGVCSNPVKETIEKTASIKEMQSKPAPKPSSKFDVLGNRLPAQTDNSGKVNR